MPMDYSDICQKAIKCIRHTGSFVQKESKNLRGKDIRDKGLNSFVTYVDQQAEDQLVKELGALIPGAGFLTEEETEDRETGSCRWIIDPIDGTTNFIYGIPCYSISVALEENGQIVIGVVYEIAHDECFYAWKGGGAYLDGEKIKVSENKGLKNGLIATGFPYDYFEHVDEYLAIFKHFMKNSRGVRRLGSAAVDLAYVACGRFDSFYEHRLNPWDVAAGSFIVQEAGGLVNDFHGGGDFIFGGEIIASSPGVHDEMKAVIHPFFKGA